MPERKNGRGGPRPGAGRPPKKRPAIPKLRPLGPILAARLDRARRERERATGAPIGLKDLAAACGVTRPTIRLILAGQADPRVSVLRALAAFLRQPVGWLLGE